MMPDLKTWPTSRLLSTAARLVEHIALAVLETGGPMAQARLAAKVRVQPQTMGKTLARLRDHGHVTCERSQTDRRSQQVEICDLGLTGLAQARALDRHLTPGVEPA